MYTRFEIYEISDRGLRAVAYGYQGTPAHTAIKAVTYYDLEVGETPSGWRRPGHVRRVDISNRESGTPRFTKTAVGSAYTDTSALMCGCGSYPTSSKSS